MDRQATLVVNGHAIRAATGATILDVMRAARPGLAGGCASGACEACRVRLLAGEVDPCGTALRDTVLACRSRVVADAIVAFDETPKVATLPGRVSEVTDLAPDIVEIAIEVPRPLVVLPGQHVEVAFAGFPAREYSPTVRLDGAADLNEIVLHVRRSQQGLVAAAIGRSISSGHAAQVRGPFGTAYHRPGAGRLVLVSTGTGFAAAWIVARAALFREPGREIHVVVGGRSVSDLYMREATSWLGRQGCKITLACSGLDADLADIRAGRSTLHLPRLGPDDEVIAFGAPAMVASVELLAAAGGARCRPVPFVPAAMPPRLRRRLREPALARWGGGST